MAKERYKVDLVALQQSCAINYRRILRLIPSLDVDEEHHFHVEEGAAVAEVTLRVIERSRFTAIVELVREVDWLPLTRITARVYLDAEMAEVATFQGKRLTKPRYSYPNPQMYHEDEKFQHNRFLGELLSHCLEFGHAADPITVG